MQTQRSRKIATVTTHILVTTGIAVTVLSVAAVPALAATGNLAASVPGVISNLTGWLTGILAGLATLLLTIGGIRYLIAGGDPGEIRAAKDTLKYAAIGYAVAALAPVLVTLLQQLVR